MYIIPRAPEASTSAMRQLARPPCGSPNERPRDVAQAPPPFGLKNLSNLPSTPFHSSASSGAGFLRVMLGQLAAYSRLSSSQFSATGSLSGMMASTGHSGSHTPQSIHSSG